MFGRTRQAYYKRQEATVQRVLQESLILGSVRQIRQRQPMVGTRKLYRMLQELFTDTELGIGRDKLFKLLRNNDMLIQKRKNYRRTTQSFHRFYKHKNLIKDIEIDRPEQVFVADITYIKLVDGFCYLALITDAYSRKIVGYDLSMSLSINGSLRALKMALASVRWPDQLIHHSDRGIQYCSDDYVKLLHKQGVKISMTEENHVYENALAERINGILKNEFLLGERLISFEVAKKLVNEAIEIYNNERLHMSLDYATPASKHAA
jgi:transposase InsO family protein